MQKNKEKLDYKIGLLMAYTVAIFAGLIYVYQNTVVRIFFAIIMAVFLFFVIKSYKKRWLSNYKKYVLFLLTLFLLCCLADCDVFPSVSRILDPRGQIGGGEEAYKSNGQFWGEKIFYVGVILFILYLSIVFWHNELRGLNIKAFFLYTSIPFLIMIFLLMPHGACPDSQSHIFTTYRYSNILLGFSEEEEWYGRADDVEYLSFLNHENNENVNPSRNSIAWALDNWWSGIEDDSLKELHVKPEHMTYYSIFCYLPQILGISVARLLGLSSAMTFGLGRIFMGIIYVLGCYRAICKAPRYKSIFAFVALIPESLTLGISYSYDAMLIVVSLNFLAGVLQLSNGIENKRALAEQLVWSFMLGAVKAGAYLLLLPMVFVITHKSKKRRWIVISSIVGMAILSVVLFDLALPSDRLFQLGGQDTSCYSAVFALQHPFSYVRMLLMTYLRKTDMIFWSGLGDHIGWWEDNIPHIYLGMMAILWFILIRRQNDTEICAGILRICSLISVILVLVISPAMLLSYTSSTASLIEGLQGRYYIPMIVPLLLLLQYKKTNGYGREKTSIFYGLSFLYVICIYYMMGFYLGR
ncbi:MAG: DUF2142 domain-containing protein [Lachnospiraceae bacterium]|nr:DUF2142 domain-containing protein [Lachnospiraceae bacterium]